MRLLPVLVLGLLPAVASADITVYAGAGTYSYVRADVCGSAASAQEPAYVSLQVRCDDGFNSGQTTFNGGLLQGSADIIGSADFDFDPEDEGHGNPIDSGGQGNIYFSVYHKYRLVGGTGTTNVTFTGFRYGEYSDLHQYFSDTHLYVSKVEGSGYVEYDAYYKQPKIELKYGPSYYFALKSQASSIGVNGIGTYIYIDYDLTQIRTSDANTNAQFVLTPEPSTFVLVGMAMLALLVRQRMTPKPDSASISTNGA